MQVTAYGWQTVPDRGVVRSRDPLQNFGDSNHITGTAETKVVKFCTQVGYINSSNRMTYHQQKGRGYGHVTVLKFCHLLWCSASRWFVRDSWATSLSRVAPIIGICRLVHWYWLIVAYIIGKYKFLLHGVSIVKIIVLERGVGHFKHKFQGEWGVAHQRLLASEN